ncbi:MAG: hypothetical protein NVS9B3_14220 [Gemmatimonadaceae bacterium]
MLMRSLAVTAIAGVTMLVAPRSAECQPPTRPRYHLVGYLPLGGDGGWDYLAIDPEARRLYVTRSTHVVVVDVDRRRVVGNIDNTPGVHGVAIARELGRGFTSNGRDSTVTIFDLATLQTIARVAVTGRNPDAIVYEPTSRRVFTFNGGSDNATALDATTGAVVGTLPLGGRPEFAAVDGAGRVFVNLENRSTIVAFDAATLTEQARWPLAPCVEPSGMAIDRAHARLFVGCANRVMAIVDVATGRVVATVPIGAGVDANAFDAATQLAFSSNGQDGTLTVVREDTPDRYSVEATVTTQRGARTMVLDEKTHRIYLSAARYGPTPPPTAGTPRPRPPIVPGSFTVLVLDR